MEAMKHIFPNTIGVMVLILDGNSEYVAHAHEGNEILIYRIRDSSLTKQKPLTGQLTRNHSTQPTYTLVTI